jgi:hypothetical protein
MNPNVNLDTPVFMQDTRLRKRNDFDEIMHCEPLLKLSIALVSVQIAQHILSYFTKNCIIFC